MPPPAQSGVFGLEGAAGLGSAYSAGGACTPVPQACRQAEATAMSRLRPLQARVQSGNYGYSEGARMTADIHKIHADYLRTCHRSETRPRCKQAALQQLRQAERAYEESMRVWRQSRS